MVELDPMSFSTWMTTTIRTVETLELLVLMATDGARYESDHQGGQANAAHLLNFSAEQ